MHELKYTSELQYIFLKWIPKAVKNIYICQSINTENGQPTNRISGWEGGKRDWESDFTFHIIHAHFDWIKKKDILETLKYVENRFERGLVKMTLKIVIYVKKYSNMLLSEEI